MEPPSKLLAHSSGDRDIDRFSELPDYIVHLILSYLDIEDIARICIVSRRCRELCLSATNLNIDASRLTKRVKKLYYLANFLDRFLGLRNRARLFSLSLNWTIRKRFPGEEFRVSTWLDNAVSCNVERITLSITHMDQTKAFVLPLSIFGSKSLEFFQLNLKMGILNLPSSSAFSELKSLVLESAEIKDKRFCEWLSLCKSLQSLKLIHVAGIKNLSIKLLSLETLKILSNYHLDCIDVVAERLQVLDLECAVLGALKIWAPEIKTLTLERAIPPDFCLGNMNFLQTATIFFDVYPSTANLVCNVPCTGETLVELLQCVGQAKVLSISGRFVEAVFTKISFPVALHGVESLRLNVNRSQQIQVQTLASFLTGLPNLKSLAIKSYAEFYILNDEPILSMPLIDNCYNTMYWESQNMEFIDQLKEAELEITQGDNELELATYLLRHATVLETLTIYYSRRKVQRKSTISSLIKALKKSCSTAAKLLVLPK